MLRSLSSARFRIILLPRKARSFPFIEDIFDKILPERGVDTGGLSFLGAGLDGNVLVNVSGILLAYFEVGIVAYVEAFHGKIVHVHPYRTSPVVLACPIEVVILAQTS